MDYDDTLPISTFRQRGHRHSKRKIGGNSVGWRAGKNKDANTYVIEIAI
jgi:hypothetical protein